jgi:hypothetical protein
MPGFALLLDRWLFAEGSLIWPYRGFVYTGFGLTLAAHLFVGDKRASARPLILALCTGVLYVAAAAAFAVGLALLLPALLAVYVGAAAMVGEVIEGRDGRLALEGLAMVLLGLLGWTPFWTGRTLGRAARRSRIRIAENVAAGPNRCETVLGATACLVICASAQLVWVTDPSFQQVKVLPPSIAALTWEPTLSAPSADRHSALIAARCGNEHLMKRSPNGQLIAIDRSPDRGRPLSLPAPDELFGGSGRHHLYICSLATGVRHHIIAVTEADPGSGSSFDFSWSSDSSALRLTGAGRLPTVSGNVLFNAVYVLRERKWYATIDDWGSS